eukprot:1099587-Pelagomonas_calceolata.AAC.2
MEGPRTGVQGTGQPGRNGRVVHRVAKLADQVPLALHWRASDLEAPGNTCYDTLSLTDWTMLINLCSTCLLMDRPMQLTVNIQKAVEKRGETCRNQWADQQTHAESCEQLAMGNSYCT